MIINSIICSDNIELMSSMPDKYVDLTVTSPPYSDLRKYKGFSWDFEKTAQELYRITKDGGMVCWVVGDKTVNGGESGESFRQALTFKEIGFTLHDTMIYQKVGCAFTPKNRYYQIFEYIFCLSKGTPKTFNPIQVRRTGHKHGSVGSNDRGTKKKIEWDETKKTRPAGNVWIINNHGRNGCSDEYGYKHEAIMPEELAEKLIISWSNPGDLVFDPFAGAGTTRKMAKKNKRNYLGVDCSQEYCDLCQKRVDLV